MDHKHVLVIGLWLAVILRIACFNLEGNWMWCKLIKSCCLLRVRIETKGSWKCDAIIPEKGRLPGRKTNFRKVGNIQLLTFRTSFMNYQENLSNQGSSQWWKEWGWQIQTHCPGLNIQTCWRFLAKCFRPSHSHSITSTERCHKLSIHLKAALDQKSLQTQPVSYRGIV